jgi:hypothetical protein
VTAAAWGAGELSSTQVQIIAANVRQSRVALFAEHAAEVVPALAPLSAADTADAMVLWHAGRGHRRGPR